MSERAIPESALRWLIVGADGLIGRHLYAALSLGGAHVQGTSRRWGSPHLYLDLAADPESWELPESDIVIIAAAAPRIADCEADPEGTAQINVHAPLQIAQQVWQRGGFVVFLSSSGVFDGVNEVPGVMTALQPLNAYGRQKAEAEQGLRAAAGEQYGLSIIRPTKILGDDTPILREWQASLSEGQSIHPHAWRWMAPITVAWAARAIVVIAASRERGIWHLSSASDVNFAEFARRWASLRGWPSQLVQPQNGAASDMQRARLDMSGTTRHFAIVPPTLDDTLSGLRGSTQ
ncbi:MAG TPA: sugar nucleotide-binding protein [Rhodocyclaceae bacterium]|nr:sugar nucleotide-binding protein [Rhodocyclaceae bacterium]